MQALTDWFGLIPLPLKNMEIKAELKIYADDISVYSDSFLGPNCLESLQEKLYKAERALHQVLADEMIDKANDEEKDHLAEGRKEQEELEESDE